MTLWLPNDDVSHNKATINEDFLLSSLESIDNESFKGHLWYQHSAASAKLVYGKKK